MTLAPESPERPVTVYACKRCDWRAAYRDAQAQRGGERQRWHATSPTRPEGCCEECGAPPGDVARSPLVSDTMGRYRGQDAERDGLMTDVGHFLPDPRPDDPLNGTDWTAVPVRPPAGPDVNECPGWAGRVWGVAADHGCPVWADLPIDAPGPCPDCQRAEEIAGAIARVLLDAPEDATTADVIPAAAAAAGTSVGYAQAMLRTLDYTDRDHSGRILAHTADHRTPTDEERARGVTWRPHRIRLKDKAREAAAKLAGKLAQGDLFAAPAAGAPAPAPAPRSASPAPAAAPEPLTLF